MNQVRPWHVLVKAILLYILANIGFAYFNPSVGKLSIYNWLVPGRQRVPYEREAEYYPVSHTIPVYEDMDAMFQSAVLSQPKRSDEFRVILLGDSSAWGFELHPEDTLAGQLTSLNLKTCSNKRIVFYNAAFPSPYAMKDLLIMDKVREYQPDMYLWTVTLDGFRNRSIYTDYFLNPYAERVTELVSEYQIYNLDIGELDTPTFLERTIVGQRSRLKKILLLQLYGFGWKATGLDYHYTDYPSLPSDQSDSMLFAEYNQGELDFDAFLFDVLDAGYELAGDAPLLVINQSIFIASGKNNEIRYNSFYPRWAYNDYLIYLDAWMNKNGHDYVNAWDLLPPSEFTSTPFHRTPRGEKMLAELLVPNIVQLSCSK